MRQTFSLIFLILAFTNCGGQNDVDLTNLQNIEIYLFASKCENKNSYHLKTEKEWKQLSTKYKTKNNIPTNFCHNFIDLENCVTEQAPFLAGSEIEKFDWTNSRIYLKEIGLEKMAELDVPLTGTPFVIKIENKVVYSGWFWNMFSSHGCDRVWAWQKPKTENYLQLNFGIAGLDCGENPLTNEKLIRNAINY